MENALFTLAELLAMPQFPGQVLLTGGPPPEEVPIRHVSVIEPPADDFVRPEELVLTTALGCTDAAGFLTFIADLQRAGAAAVCLSFEDPRRRVPEEVLAFARARALPLVLLPWELRFADIVENVLDRIRTAREQAAARWESFQSRLLSLYLSGGTLGQALGLLAGETWCDALLTDRAGRALASTAPAQGDGWKLLLPLRAQGREVGALFLSGGRATPEYLDGLSAWAPYILTPLLLWLDRAELRSAAQDQLREELVRGLAEGAIPDTAENRARAQLLGLRLGQPAVCLAAADEGWDDALREALRAALHTRVSAPAALTGRGAVLFLSPDEPPERTAEVLRAAAAAHAPALRLHWGCSGSGRDWASLYEEAMLAADLCRHEDGARIYLPADTQLFRILRPCLGSGGSRSMRERLLAPLRDYDRGHGGELETALLGLFDCGGNVSETARALHLHRQALRYRLQKAEELLGFPLSDHRRALALELALRLGRLDGE